MKLHVFTTCCLIIAIGAAGATLAPVRAETVLITGSNQGIGYEFARQYAARGWTVIATHRRDTIPDTLAELQKQYPNVRVEQMDVTNHEQIIALAEKMRGEPIDILLNNAALIRFAPIRDREGNAGQLFGTLDYNHFDQFMRTNVAGPLKIAEAFVENVKAGKLKKMVTISSAAGMVSRLPRSADHYWYRISKAALNSAMRLLSVDLADEGVTVVMFHPGGVQVESWGIDGKLPGVLTPEEAIGIMIKTIDGLTIKDSGRFINNDGTDMPW
jgi:NAD(P)-dependent dehydrogenase (short-subunit alcohol dehydrogenase family)